MSSTWVLRTEAYEGLGMVVGAEAEACGSFGMAVGVEAEACGSFGMAVGFEAEACGSVGWAVGAEVEAGGWHVGNGRVNWAGLPMIVHPRGVWMAS